MTSENHRDSVSNETPVMIRFEDWDRYPTPTVGKDSCVYLLMGWHLYFYPPDEVHDQCYIDLHSKAVKNIPFAKEVQNCSNSWFSEENWSNGGLCYDRWLEELYEKEIIFHEDEGSFCQDYALWLFDLKYNTQPRCEKLRFYHLGEDVCFQTSMDFKTLFCASNP